MEARPFRQPVGWAISLQFPNEGQGTKNIKIQCPSITKNKNQTQWKFTTALVVPLHDNSAMATDPAPSVPQHVYPATSLTTEMDD